MSITCTCQFFIINKFLCVD
ncbi:hypothetical protein FOG26_11640 [Staphylococcus cohnii]|nr:hypothetical protein [Staphylococcus cohnii]